MQPTPIFFFGGLFLFTFFACKYLFRKKEDTGFIVFIVSMLVPFLWMIVGFILSFEKVWEVEQRYQLVSMADKEGYEGSFYLGSGSFQNEEYYSYYYKMVDGGYRKAKTKVYPSCNDSGSEGSVVSVTIHEDVSRDQAELRVLSLGFHNKNLGWLVYNNKQLKKEFHIPVGSLHKDYQLK